MAKYDPKTKLWGPEKKPTLKSGDFHLIVNDEAETIKCFDHTGKLRWTKPALAKGWNGRTTWRNGGDTPPGLYHLGQYFPWTTPPDTAEILAAYGHCCWDMVEMENQENERGRSGICLHGKGSKPYQPLTVTSGCVRMHNKDLEDYVLPLTHVYRNNRWTKRNNMVYISVFQDYDK